MSTSKAYLRLAGFAVMLLLLPMPALAASAPHIASLTPTCGPTGGSTNVTIAGDNFTDVAAVTFGGTPATSFSVVSSTTITCITPGHAAGAVDVVVTTAGGNATKSGGFTYVADAVANAYPPVIQGNAQAVAVDAAGNRYVTGYFSGTVDFNSGVGLDPKASGGGFDAFVTRFNADGTYAWTQTFGGTSDDYGRGVAVSPDGKWVYVAGSFKSTDAGIGGGGTVASSGSSDAFVLALNVLDGSAVSGFGSDGVQEFGGKGDDAGFGVAVSPDGATVYVTGHFNSIDAGLGGIGTFASSGGYDAFVLALKAADGSAISSFGTGGIQKFGGTEDDYGRGVVVAPNGENVYVTGYFKSKDAGIGGTGGVIRIGGFDAFALALNASTGGGVPGFGSGGIQKIGGTNDDFGYGVAISPDGKRVYVTGSFTSSDAGIGSAGTFGSSGGLDAFVVALSSGIGSGVGGFGSGGFQKFGGSSTDSGQGVAVSPDGAMIYVTGYFKSTDAGIGATGTVAAAGSYDAFVLALNAPDGGAVLGFGSGGIQTFGGSNDDEGYGVAVSPDGAKIYAAGYFSSTDARVGGAGSYYDATGFGGFLLELDAPPTINTVRPVCGGAPGGTNVTITGTNFFSGVNVTFGGTAATLVNVVSSTTIKCLTPAHPPGVVDVVVTTSGGSATKTGGFTYVADAVANVYPPVIQGFAQAVAVDAAGNRYVAGSFRGAVDFNPGVGVDAKLSAGVEDAFVTRFNADGTYAWTQTFSGTGDDLASGVAVSPDGSRVYVTGSFSSTDAGLGGTGSVGSSGLMNAFVLALNAPDGGAVLGFGSGGVQTFGGSSADSGQGVAVSPDGTRVYVTGSFGSHDAGIGHLGSIASLGESDAFVLALSTLDGSAIGGFGSGGVQQFSGGDFDHGTGVAVSPDGSRVYVTGSFSSHDAGIGHLGSIAASGGSDAFVLALNASNGLGVLGFGSGGVQTFGGPNNDYGGGVAVSPDGSRVYVTGSFNSNNAGIGGTGSIASSGLDDAFVLALNASNGLGVLGFGSGGIQTFGGPGFDYGYGVAVSPDGSRVYVTGYSDMADARIGGTGPVGFSAGSFDAFVLALNASTGLGVGSFGSGGIQTFGGADEDYVGGVAVSPDGARVYVTGNFLSTGARVGGAGPAYDATGFYGFLLGLDVPPSIDTIRPACGGTGGGTSVTIRGSAFTSGATVTFGGTAATPVNVVNSTTITSTTPGHAAGAVDVVVTTPGGSATKTGGFTYVADAVANVYPPIIQGYAEAVAVDTAGNRYVAGCFSGAKDFNPGVGLDAKASASTDANDAFVTRFNADGTYAWTQTFGGTGSDAAFGVAVSPDGSRVYVTGYFDSNDAGIGGTGSFRSSGNYDAFILALNAADGSAVGGFGSGGVQNFGGTEFDGGYGVAVSPDGSKVYVTGYFFSTDAGIGSTGGVRSSGGSDAFVLALDAADGSASSSFGSGGVQTFGGTGSDAAFGVAVSPDGSTVYVTGSFASNNAGIGGMGSIFPSGGSDAFVLALNASTGLGVGSFGSGGVQKFGGSGNDEGEGVAVSPDGLRVYVTGDFMGTDAGIGHTGSIASSGWDDAFVLALNAADGSAITGFGSGGVQTFGGTSYDVGFGVAVSPDGSRVYATGYFVSTDAGIGGTVSVASAGGYDAFVLALNAPDGSAISGFGRGGVQTFGGTGDEAWPTSGVAVSPDGTRVYVTGDFFTASHDARVGGAGPTYDSTGFGGFLLGLGATTGQQAPTHLVITRVNGGINPVAGVPFAVSVESRDPQDAASVVTLDTAIHLTLRTGTGALGGTLTGMIAAGTSSGTISGVTYTTAEGGVVVTVSRTSGDTLAPGDSAPFTVAGPFAKFAFVLASPQTDGVAFTGANTLTAQDVNGNTVTTFDASADNVTITANAPLAGKVSGLGVGANNVLNRAKDFASGVADLTALGMIYSGNLDTGTFTATSSTGATGVSGSVTINNPGPGQPGTDMQVVMWLTIPASVSIAWGGGTTGKTAGDVTPLDWTVKDAGGDQLACGETCVSNDANNNLAMNLENTTNTGTKARAYAAVTNSGGWNIGGAPATDTFAIQAQLGTNPQAGLAGKAQELTGTATLAKGVDQPLVMTVMTPTDITRDAGVQKTIFVVLTATPE